MPALHVVVLAAGQGKRMKSDLPKVLHGLAGRPLLAHVLDAADELEPAATYVVYGHGGRQVPQAFPERAVQWVHQREQRGTGHAVEQVMPSVPDDGLVLVLYGDVPLLDASTLRRAVEAAARGALAVITVALEDASGYGRVVRDDAGHVRAVVEERDATPEQLAIDEVNTGIIAVAASSLRRWLARLDDDNAQGELYLTDVIVEAVSEGVEVATVAPECVEEVLGVNDRAQLAHLERHAQRRMAEALMLGGVTVADPTRLDVRGEVRAGRDVRLDVNVVLEGRVVIADGAVIGANACIRDAEIGPGTEILPNCVIEDAVIGADCRIGPFARLRPGTVLDDEVHVGNFVEVKATRIGRGSKANHLTYLGDSELGSNVNVGAGTITCNYDGASKHRTVIGDNVFVGSGVELVAPLTVHDDATIGAGSTITKDAPAGELTLSRHRQVSIKRWSRPSKREK